MKHDDGRRQTLMQLLAGVLGIWGVDCSYSHPPAAARRPAVVAGAGGAGLAAAITLAARGFEVVVLEKLGRAFLHQSGLHGGQGRLHSGAYYALTADPEIGKELVTEAQHFRARFPAAVEATRAHYFVPRAHVERVEKWWRAVGVTFSDPEPSTRPEISADLQRRFDLRCYRVVEDVIDTPRLRDTLLAQCERAGVRIVYDAEVAGSERDGARIQQIITTSRGGQTARFPCALWFNATGAAVEWVERRVNPSASLKGLFSIECSGIVRTAAPVPRGLIQFVGVDAIRDLAVIPVGGQKDRVSLSLHGGNPISDPSTSCGDDAGERRRIVDACAAGVPGLRIEQTAALEWCMKSRLTHPGKLDKRAASRLATVLTSREIGGARNAFLGSPGKLGSLSRFMDTIDEALAQTGETSGTVEGAAVVHR